VALTSKQRFYLLKRWINLESLYFQLRLTITRLQTKRLKNQQIIPLRGLIAFHALIQLAINMVSPIIPTKAVKFVILDLCPDELKDKFQNIVKKYKNNRKPGNKRSYERGHSEAKGYKDKDMGNYLKKAYHTLVKKDDLSSNGDLVFAIAMQNYN
jgi:hypothetical protein